MLHAGLGTFLPEIAFTLTRLKYTLHTGKLLHLLTSSPTRFKMSQDFLCNYGCPCMHNSNITSALDYLSMGKGMSPAVNRILWYIGFNSIKYAFALLSTHSEDDITMEKIGGCRNIFHFLVRVLPTFLLKLFMILPQ